jgi:hypothetical protein
MQKYPGGWFQLLTMSSDIVGARRSRITEFAGNPGRLESARKLTGSGIRSNAAFMRAS